MTRRMLLPALLAIAAAAGFGLAAGQRRFRRDLAAARARIAGRSRTVSTPHGPVEYAEAGAGAPILVIHGSGGGFDQGLAFAAPLAGAGRRVIAPSRFGYLGSPLPPDPSPQAQADAFASLLDRLGIEKVAVCGGSAGALSALEFALRHPVRTAALVLVVPAVFRPREVPRAWSPVTERLVTAALGSDLLFWAAIRLAPRLVIRHVLATDPALVDRAAPEERARVQAMLEGILPVGPRARGILEDTRRVGNPAPVAAERMTVPTLILSCADDLYGTAAAARDLAARIPGAELVIHPAGGHLLVGCAGESRAAIARFLDRSAG
jgi:pimeloyl-ACP methyl ester carboxylesterase